MKQIFFFLMFAGVLTGKESVAQTPTAYKVPDMFRFDYTVDQVLISQKQGADTSVMHFAYTKSGDYAAIRMSGREGSRGNLTMVISREGMGVIFNERHKEITVINIRKLASDFATGLTKWIRMDSLMANMHRKGDGHAFKSVKTGNTQSIGNYTAEEYTMTGKRHHSGSLWFAHVDFNTMGDYMMGAMGANWIKMIGFQKGVDPLFQAMTQPKTLITAIDLKDSTGAHKCDMHTLAIDPVTSTISTSGYTINDYSNMTMPEIFEAEMKKRN
jgi:hypothetical protein